jgi:hypothetical protein
MDILNIPVSSRLAQLYERAETAWATHGKTFQVADWNAAATSQRPLEHGHGTVFSAQTVLTVRTRPARNFEALMGHELYHLILLDQGYPWAFPALETAPDFANPSQAEAWVTSLIQRGGQLSNIVTDPLIDLLLVDMGFEMEPMYKSLVNEEIGWLRRMPGAANRRIEDNLQPILHYILTYFVCKEVFPSLLAEQDRIFKRYFPEALPVTQALVQAMEAPLALARAGQVVGLVQCFILVVNHLSKLSVLWSDLKYFASVDPGNLRWRAAWDVQGNQYDSEAATQIKARIDRQFNRLVRNA